MFAKPPKALLVVALLALGSLMGTGLAIYSTTTHSAPAIEWLDSPRVIADFELMTAQQPLNLSVLAGDWHLLLFGYTHCPDICPNSLAELRRLSSLLGEQAPQVIFISIDPARDTVQSLADYVTYFDPDFVGATGEQAQLQSIADSLGIRFKVTGPAQQPQIAHSLTISLVGPKGKLQGRLRPGFDVEAAATQIIKIEE